ncbi:fatty acid desaturase family protein [Fodinibius sediminis]|uniref:Linoleoyl-CoA desaturase n=1 Tax=Fodinibius sediminis TaxID=1214077 RepID=A0A521BWF8_9BACT|nr:acyl-CoA desaturase [Fodinibius sediminis]SMO51523.1 linoleoyl-CoA desaturase [Fodinibius sediminis]
MSPTRISFKSKERKGFARELKHEVNSYFRENNISKHADHRMVLKTVVLLTLYFGSYGLIISNSFGLWGMAFLCFVMGIGMAGIGFSVSHDALHGAYSSNKYINQFLGYTFDLLGANGYIWKITHNIIHHTYTNIYEHDEDLEVAEFIRLSPNAEHKPIHRIQHILAFIAYGFATLFWVFIKDYKYFFQSSLGPYEDKSHPLSEWVTLILTKLIYYGYILVLPYMLLPVTWWQIAIGFFILHFTAGIILGVVFQLAHVVEGTEHPTENEEGNIENTWMIHQLETTSDFAHENKLLCWYIGGLNYQIEHHLFPKVCSIHYPAISSIVRSMAEKYDIPYNYHPTLGAAIASHYHTLQQFGRPAAD